MANPNREKSDDAVDVTAVESRSSSFAADTSPGSDSSASSKTRPSEARQWWPTLIQFGPLSGIFGLLIALASIVASLGLLVGSDGQDVQNWTTPVSTYLAIFTAVANLSIRYAAFQGVVITWWLRACKGSTLSQLHWSWRSGTTIRGALSAGRNVGLLGTACIFSTLVMIDGPLLQRASTTINTPYVNDAVPLNISMAVEVPSGFTGSWSTDKLLDEPGYHWTSAFNNTIPAPKPRGSVPNSVQVSESSRHGPWTSALRNWYLDLPLEGAVTGCPGRCRAKIMAPALTYSSCETRTIVSDYGLIYDQRKVEQGIIAPPLAADTFMIDTALVLDENESINLITGYGTMEGAGNFCKGNFTYTACTLEAAVGLYDVDIVNDRIDIQNLQSPTIVALANNTAVNRTYIPTESGFPSTLGGIVTVMYTKWEALATYFQQENGKISSFVAGASLFAFLKESHSGCESWYDPHESVKQSLDQLMFYTGAAAAFEDESYLVANMDSNLPVNKTIIGHLEGDHTVFHTTYWYFLAAALIEVACVLAILPTFFCFWQLGRPVSFSPLEIAKAFKSPLLAECNSNSTGREIAQRVGRTFVRYGVEDSDHVGNVEKSRLGFGDSSANVSPQKGAAFDN